MNILFGAFLLFLNVNLGLSGLCRQPIDALDPEPSDIKYYLYTQPGSTYTQLISGQLSDAPYKPNASLVFLTHGFNQSGYFPWIQDMKDKMFVAKPNSNVVIIDWSEIAAMTNYFNSSQNLIYPYTAWRTSQTGVLVGKFIIEIVNAWGVAYSDILCVGHSLGAHLFGSAGQAVQETGNKLGECVGLDPAGPLFSLIANEDCRLSSDDAEIVTTIRTDQGGFGYYGPIAVDYYVNGGNNQPGCPSFDYPNPLICSHCYAFLLYTDTLTSNGEGFDSRLCTDYATYKAGLCNSNTLSQMGYYSNATTLGSNYLDTNAKPPYGKSGSLNTQTITLPGLPGR